MQRRAALLILAVALCALQCGRAQVLSLGPSSQVFVSPQVVGSNASGSSVSFYGCQNVGTTLESFTLWANAEYVRGMSVTLTNRSTILYGCVNVTSDGVGGGDGCNTSDVRSSTFRFEAGERVTNMTLWPGYDSQRQPSQRAGAVTFSTSLGRLYDFGMNDTRINAVVADVGSGIPCGVNNRAGADIDGLGFVFLRNVTSSVLTNVQYEGVERPTDLGALQGFVDGNSTTLVLSNQTYNNSIQTTNLTATFASDTLAEVSNYWSTDTGLDMYLTSSVNAPTPVLSSNSSADSSASWTLSASASHDRSESNSSARSWNYTVNVLPGGVSRVAVTAIQSGISTSFNGTLNVTLDSGFVMAIPVEGSYEGSDMSPTNVLTTQIIAGKEPSQSKSGSSNTLAWVLGVIFGVLGGLLIAALLAWLILRHKRKRQHPQEGAESKQGKTPHSFFVLPGVGKHGDKGQKGQDKADIEMGTTKTGGKEGWESHSKDSTVMGVPVNGSQAARQNEGLPEGEGAVVVPYNKFRRLRLDSIRQALGLAEADAAAQRGAAASGEGTYTPPRNTPEGLSNPPSGASTPRSISNSLLPAATKFDTPFTRDSPAAGSEEDQKSETGRGELKMPSPVPIKSRSPRKASSEGLYSSKIKDRVAAIRAERQRTPSPKTSPTPPASAGTIATPQAATPQADRPTPGSPEDPNLKATTPMDKGKLMFQRLRSSISSSMPRRANEGKIEHDNTSISLTGKPRAASQATPVEPPPPSPKLATPPTPTPEAKTARPSASPKAGAGQGRSPRAHTPGTRTPQPSVEASGIRHPDSTTSKTPSTTPKASASGRTSSRTPAPSTPSQRSPRGGKAMWEEALPDLKLTPRASAKPSKFMDFDDSQIKLGEKYHTQGRNE